jgi:ubiquinone/menaquinone biosynthesis C-methylase UbiE
MNKPIIKIISLVTIFAFFASEFAWAGSNIRVQQAGANGTGAEIEDEIRLQADNAQGAASSAPTAGSAGEAAGAGEDTVGAAGVVRAANSIGKQWGPNDNVQLIVEHLDEFDRYCGEEIQQMVQSLMEKWLRPGPVLEIGSGFGRLWKYASSTFKSDWTSLDWNQGLIDEAKRRGWGNNFVVGSVYDMAFPDSTFENVVGLASFDAFEDITKAIVQTARVLKPGGRFIHMLDILPYPDYINDELKALAEEAFGIKSKGVIMEDPFDVGCFWNITLPVNAEDAIRERYKDTSLYENAYKRAFLEEMVLQIRGHCNLDYCSFLH